MIGKILIFISAILTLSTVYAEKNVLLITKNGKSPYTIIRAVDAAEPEKKAIQELTQHIKAASGVNIPVKTENSKFSGPAIYIGQTAFARKYGILFQNYGKEEWLIKVIGKDIVIGGGRPRGTIYGVWEFLERRAGIMWLDEKFTYLPELNEITVPDNFELKGKPAFAIRCIYAYHRNPQKARRLFMARNRQNLFHGESGLGYLKAWGIYKILGSPRECHTYYNYTKDWGPENENCFSLSKSGKRLRAVNPSGPGQVCLTNPKTRKLFAAELRGFIEADRAGSKDGNYPWIYDISANDNNSKCVCPKCLAAAKKYGSYSGLVLEFTNAIADSIAGDYPDVKVQMFAYMFAQEVPENIKARPNVIVRLAQLGSEWAGAVRDSLRPLSHPNNEVCRQQVLGWSKIASLAIWDYWIMYLKDTEASSCTPAIVSNLRFYHDKNVISILIESEKPLDTCFYALRIWLGFRFMNNPDLDAATEIDRFMKVYYGPAAPFMKEFLKYLEKRNAEIKKRLTDLPVQRRTDLDDAFFIKADKLFAAAEAAVAGKPDYLRRIAKERVVIDRVRLLRKSELKPFDTKPEIERLKKNYFTACEDYLSPGKNKLQFQNFLESLTIDIPPPEKFKNANIAFDITWGRLRSCTRQAKIIKIPDAAGGKAIVLKKFKDTGDLHYGFYDVSNKKQKYTIKLKRKSLPQDEKFHFYKIGRVNLPPKSYVWAHPTWYIQNKLNEFYKPNGNNNYEIFVSLKVQGPAYVTGSKKENAVMMDRILLVR